MPQDQISVGHQGDQQEQPPAPKKRTRTARDLSRSEPKKDHTKSQETPDTTKEKPVAEKEISATSVTTQELTPTAQIELPNAHIDHTANYKNELVTRQHGLNSALLALRTAKEGAEIAHNTALADMNERHLKVIADLDRRLFDLERNLSAVERGLEDIESTEAAPDETDETNE